MDQTFPESASVSEVSKLESLLQKFPIILQLLRFIAIGVINTALDFIILNFLSKLLGINSGTSLGALNIISFSLAVVQSYFWNKYWTFGSGQVSLLVNFKRLVLVGGVGGFSLLAVLIGAKLLASPVFYLVVLAIFIISQLSLWIAFRLSHATNTTSTEASKQFLTFVVVSLIGLLINSILVSLLSTRIPQNSFINADLVKNLAKVLATGASLVWNFIGYKLVVFRK